MLKLATRNLLRHRKRTATAVVAIAFGVVCVILIGGFFQNIYEGFAEAIIRGQTGHVQIHAQGYRQGGFRKPGEFNLGTPAQLVAGIESDSQVKSVMQRLSLYGLLNNGRADMPVVVEGGEAEKEARFAQQVKVRAGRLLNANDRFAAVLGRGLSEALQLNVGDQAVLMANTAGGAVNTIDLEIVGIIETYSQDYDAKAVRMPIASLQELFGAPVSTGLVIELKSTDETEAFLGRIAPQLQAAGVEWFSWRELADFYEKTVELYQGQFRVVKTIVTLLLFLSVANAVSMSMFERTAEFATMMAVGVRRSRVAAQVVLEILLLSLLGALIGLVLGLLAAALISTVGIDMPPGPNSTLGYVARIVVTPGLCLDGVLIGLCSGAIASIPSAFRVWRLSITDGLRYAV